MCKQYILNTEENITTPFPLTLIPHIQYGIVHYNAWEIPLYKYRYILQGVTYFHDYHTQTCLSASPNVKHGEHLPVYVQGIEFLKWPQNGNITDIATLNKLMFTWE